PSLIDERTAWRILTSSREDWERTAGELKDEDLRLLIRGLLLHARSYSRMIGGSASPVITLYREVVKRAPAWEPDLTAWIVAHRTNPYEPFGTGDDYGAESWAQYSERSRKSRDRALANIQTEADRQTADKARRRPR